MSRRRSKKLPEGLFTANIESLTHEGKGVAHIDDKVIFIDGALPSERVRFRYTERKRNYDQGQVVEVIEASVDRVEPHCPHFGVCGGCSLQHLNAEAQIKSKNAILLDNLQRIGHVLVEGILEPIVAQPWSYRRRARLGVKYVFKKEKVLVGFREKRSPYLADITECKVLDERVGGKITALCDLIASLTLYQRIPQIEVAMGDEDVALVFRHLDALPESDERKLVAFGQTHGFQIYGQIKGPATIKKLWAPNENSLAFSLPDHNISLDFRPSDFTQVNIEVNRQMVSRALTLLQLEPSDRVLDLFCGLGNFTLPIARQVKHVVGVEGSEDLVRQAQLNARANDIENAEFHAVDLTKSTDGLSWASLRYEKVLIDPPRSGALAMMAIIAEMKPRRIVYVSCNPATLARDAQVLVNTYGYSLKQAGVMDMFPHTTHVESIAVFERG